MILPKMLKKTLSKKLSELNQISRKKAEALIKEQGVLLNGVKETRPYISVTSNDDIKFQKQKNKKINLVLFHKPKGCITSRKDEKDRTVVYDYLPKKFANYHYIGRLDYNSEGLLLFTDHAPYKRHMESPKSKIKRVYLVNTIGSFNDVKLKAMNQKIYATLNYQKPRVILAHSNKNKHTLRFELLEGKNREIRNICEIFNLKVEKLKRISFGKYFLKTVPHANYKEIQINESY